MATMRSPNFFNSEKCNYLNEIEEGPWKNKFFSWLPNLKVLEPPLRLLDRVFYGRQIAIQGNDGIHFVQRKSLLFNVAGILGGIMLASYFVLNPVVRANETHENSSLKGENQVSEGENLKKPEEETIKTKYLIIGLGMAAYSALEEIKKLDKDAQILLIGEEPYLPYSRPPLSKELWATSDPKVTDTLLFKGFDGKESSIWLGNSEIYNDKNITVVLGHRVEDIDVKTKAIMLDDGRIIKFEKCLIATGGTPRTLPGLPEDCKGKVTTYRTLNDFKQLYHRSEEIRHIVVIGGGFLGSELACGLAKHGQTKGLKITQVFPESGLMGLAFPKFLSDYATKRVRQELGIDIRPERLVSKVNCNGEKVILTLDNNEQLEADHVVVAVGIKPNADIAIMGDMEIDPKNGGIVVNSELEARSDIFVAGDVASYYDVHLGRRRVEHHDHARASGAHAGKNMVGAREPYNFLPMFWSDVSSMGYEAVGTIDASLQTVSVWDQTANGTSPALNDSNPDYKRGIVYYLKEDRVVGVILWNVWNKVDDARVVIKKAKKFTDISQLKNQISLEEEHTDH